MLKIGTFFLAALLAADVAPQTYTNDFSKMPPGKPGAELFILSGAFKVAEENGNRFLELPGNPVDGFGLLFGPEGVVSEEVAARIYGTNDGKLFPEFGIGTNDAAGWKAWVLPGQKAVVLRKRDEERARVPFEWKSGTWTRLKLRVTAAEGKWNIQGKAWSEGAKEPEAWTIQTQDTATPATGRASLWGQPYAGTPIRFDDLSATALK